MQADSEFLKLVREYYNAVNRELGAGHLKSVAFSRLDTEVHKALQKLTAARQQDGLFGEDARDG